MNTAIRNILTSWAKSLVRYDKLDDWQLCENLSTVGNYIVTCNDGRKTKDQMRQIRDFIISDNYNPGELLEKITNVLDRYPVKGEKTSKQLAEEKKWHRKTNGQKDKYKGETRKIFTEKLKFKDGMPLRKFDIDTESAKDSRKVRRIIEKRMCQAYHKMRHSDSEYLKDTNKDRYWMKRATSFQLHNIGQVENKPYCRRGKGTHWKRMYDPQTGVVVLKKKMAYSCLDEAMAAIEKFELQHPEDKGLMQAYKCKVCGKWHIGHTYDSTSFDDTECESISFQPAHSSLS